MLWTVCHLWPSGACSVFNCYHNHFSLVLRIGDGTATIINIREVVTQGDPLDMFAYRIGILPLIKLLKLTYSDVIQAWFADNTGALGTFNHLERYSKAIKNNGLERGYYPDPTKMILVVHIQKLKEGRLFGGHQRFKVCTGAHYLGDYTGYNITNGDWIKSARRNRRKTFAIS